MCMDSLQTGALVWCRTGCGNGIHHVCLGVWASHRLAQGGAVTCPMCRTDWPQSDLNKPTTSHPRVRCAACSGRINGSRYCCVLCRDVSLCGRCFARGAHAMHPFLVQHSVGSSLVPAPRDQFGTALPPEVCQLQMVL